ncbi:MAG: sensor histidine kinase, partial [Ignavibacteria bacterium]
KGIKYIQKKSYTWTNSKNETGELGVLQDVTKQNLQKQQLEKQNKILNALNRFTQVVLSKKDAEHDLNKLLKYLGEASHCDRVYLFRKENDSDRFSLNAFWFGQNDKLNDSLYEIGFNEDQIKFITEKLSAGKVITSHSNSSSQPKSEIIYPIFVNDRLEGFLGFDNFSEKMNLTEAEMDALSISAKVIGASFELTEYINEIIVAKKEAQKSDRLKSEFISQISHEIRSPLNIIMSFLGMIWEELKDDDRLNISELYETIKKAGNRLVRTIDLLIDASTIQSGTYEANFEKIDFIDDIVFPAVAQFRDISERKKLLLLRESSSAERIILGDKRSLSGVIVHILDNAVKYTDEGYIKINDYNEDNYLVVEISDSGRGISKQYLDNIFRPFTQENEGLSRSFEGLGLGMYIVKKYCELNDAEVYIDSKPSQGTKFTIKLPLAASKKGNFETRES